MKTLYLVRHAKSSWDNPDLSDFERPLNKRGKRDAPRMGGWLREQGITPDLILTSPAKRALTTAKALMKGMELKEGVLRADKSMYLASPEAMFEVISNVDDEVQHLFLVGHNPGHTELANRLSEARIDNLPTGAIFAASFAIQSWSDLKPYGGKFLFFQYPKNLH